MFFSFISNGWAQEPSEKAIRVQAEQLEFDVVQSKATYRGKVQVSQGGFVLTADRVEVFFVNQRPERLEAYGKPVRFSQTGTEKVATWRGQSQRLTYRFQTSLLELKGEAELRQGDNVIRSETLTYNLNARRFEAGGGKGVEMLLFPETLSTP